MEETATCVDVLAEYSADRGDRGRFEVGHDCCLAGLGVTPIAVQRLSTAFSIVS